MKRFYWHRFWQLIGLSVGAGVGYLACVFLPMLNAYVAPVRVNFSYSNIHRNQPGDYAYPALCFTLHSDKIRPSTSPNMDVFVNVRAATEIVHAVSMWFDPNTHNLWQSNYVPAPGKGLSADWCAPLPPGTTEKTPVVMDTTIFYPGWYNFWLAPTHLPPLVDEMKP